MHGGNAKRGMDNPNWKHGLYSKSMPARLAAKFERALGDPNLLSLRNEAALITTLIDDAIARLDSAETGKLWVELRDAWNAMLTTSNEKRGDALNAIGRMIMRGASDADAARELRGVVLDKVRVAESERKRLVDMQQMITMEQMLTLVGALTSAVHRVVVDREQRSAILDQFQRLIPAPSDTTVVHSNESRARAREPETIDAT